MLLDERSHIMRSELGSMAQLAVSYVIYPAERGTPDVAAVQLIHRKMTSSRVRDQR